MKTEKKRKNIHVHIESIFMKKRIADFCVFFTHPVVYNFLMAYQMELKFRSYTPESKFQIFPVKKKQKNIHHTLNSYFQKEKSASEQNRIPRMDGFD